MFWLVHVFCFISRPMDEWKMRKASAKVAESLMKPQKIEVSESEVIQTNKGYDVFISYCHQNKAHADKLLTALRFLTVLISYFTLLIVLFFIYFMYLLTEWKGRTGKYLARGHGVRTERSEVRAP